MLLIDANSLHFGHKISGRGHTFEFMIAGIKVANNFQTIYH
jgi:hypothetical protein